MTALGVTQSDLDEVEAIVRRAGTSFYRGMRILPPDRRAAMYGIYAFCRLVDDIADETAPLNAKIARLGDWRARIGALRATAGRHSLDRVLQAATLRFDLREADFLAVIDGMEMDAGAPIVAPDLATLDLYCDRVAAAVGRLSVRAFGDASPHADQVAFALGRALQLTNILRDVSEDAALGRLYLPCEYLAAAGVPADPMAALASPGLPNVCRQVAAMAHARFDEAHAAMRRCDRRAMRPARLMGATYAAVLSQVERRGWPADGRASLPRHQKMWIALRYGLL